MTEPTPRYNKVTVIFEDGESTTTIRIPQAMDIGIQTDAVPIHEWGDARAIRSFSTELLDVKISLRALFDHDAGNIMATEKSTIAKEVEVDWVAIPTHPDYIINRNGDVRWANDNLPVPYQKGLGEDWYALKLEDGWSRFHSRYALRDEAFPNG